MKRKKSLSPPPLYLSAAVLMCACGIAVASPAQVQNLHNNIAAAKFQAVLQQQDFFTILMSIEERLRSLDSIYSMQLAQTLDTKLDQYSRKLEALDTKIIRLEALVMLNLDKISENISTKNFKDDMAKTNLLRKMDSVYEGISHRLGYMERKCETNMVKIQTKVDAISSRLEKIEENMMARESDIETEISDAIFAIDDLKTTCTAMEEKLYNLTSATLNITKESYRSTQNMNVDSRKSMNVLHDNIIENLRYMNNKTSKHFKMVEDNNVILRTMKTELKEDFNEYANKVADMSSYIWKNSDTTEDDLKRLETAVNSTKTEVQNGVRSLMLQIGKISSKDNAITSGENSLEEMNKNLNTNFQKILTNQDLFLESCHRLQMDESQIESEISVMLEKLIDMLEKKMASEMKDIKNLEKALKTHDSRISRNVYQINSNVISLFEKSTINNEALSREMKKIGNDLNALFAFVQSTVTVGSPQPFSMNPKVLHDKLNKIESIISAIPTNRTQLDPTNIQAPPNLHKEILERINRLSEGFSAIESLINNTLNEKRFDKIINEIRQKYHNCSENINATVISTDEIHIDNETRKAIQDIFGPNPDLVKSNPIIENVTTDEVYIDRDTRKNIKDIFGPNPNLINSNPNGQNGVSLKSKCKQNYRKLINVRSGISEDCGDRQHKSTKKKKKTKKRPYLLDVRGGFEPEESVEYEDSEDDFESTTLEVIDEDVTTETSTILNEDTSYVLEIKPNTTINNI